MSSEEIISLGKVIAAFGAAQEDILGRLLSAAENADDAANNLLNLLSLSQQNLVWIDCIDGDDENDGRSSETPVKSWARIFELSRSTARLLIRSMDQLIVDSSVTLTIPPNSIRIEGRTKDGASGARQQMIFNDAINSSSLPGGIRFLNACPISTINIDVVLNYSRAISPIQIDHGYCTLHFHLGSFTKLGNSDAALINLIAGHIRASAFVIDPSASGFIVRNVGSGDDPNDVPGLSANFDAA